MQYLPASGALLVGERRMGCCETIRVIRNVNLTAAPATAAHTASAMGTAAARGVVAGGGDVPTRATEWVADVPDLSTEIGFAVHSAGDAMFCVTDSDGGPQVLCVSIAGL
jgi:hypothetical protein